MELGVEGEGDAKETWAGQAGQGAAAETWACLFGRGIVKDTLHWNSVLTYALVTMITYRVTQVRTLLLETLLLNYTDTRSKRS